MHSWAEVTSAFIPSTRFFFGNTYTFKVTLHNFLGFIGVGTTSIEISSYPSVNLLVDDRIVIKKNDPLRVRTKLSGASCNMNSLDVNETGEVILYRWNVYKNNKITLLLENKAVDPGHFYLSPYALEVNNEYSFEIIAYSTKSHSFSSAKVICFVESGDVHANILGGDYYTVQHGLNIALDASSSYASDMPSSFLQYKWLCFQIIPFATSCPSSMRTSTAMTLLSAGMNMLRINGSALNTSTTYLIQLNLYANGKSDSKLVTINVLPFKSLFLPTVFLNLTEFDSWPLDGVINPSNKMVISAQISAMLNKTYDISWSYFPVGSFSFEAGTLLRSNFSYVGNFVYPLHLPPATLIGGITYCFHLAIRQVGTNDPPIVSEILVSVNSPPNSGNLIVSPKYGYFGEKEYSTTFAIMASRWCDTDVPLSYSFFYCFPVDATYAGRNGFVLLGDIYHNPVLYSYLPAGDSNDGMEITLMVKVFDSMGAYSTSTTTARVYPVSFMSASSLLSFSISCADSSIHGKYPLGLLACMSVFAPLCRSNRTIYTSNIPSDNVVDTLSRISSYLTDLYLNNSNSFDFDDNSDVLLSFALVNSVLAAGVSVQRQHSMVAFAINTMNAQLFEVYVRSKQMDLSIASEIIFGMSIISRSITDGSTPMTRTLQSYKEQGFVMLSTSILLDSVRKVAEEIYSRLYIGDSFAHTDSVFRLSVKKGLPFIGNFTAIFVLPSTNEEIAVGKQNYVNMTSTFPRQVFRLSSEFKFIIVSSRVLGTIPCNRSDGMSCVSIGDPASIAYSFSLFSSNDLKLILPTKVETLIKATLLNNATIYARVIKHAPAYVIAHCPIGLSANVTLECPGDVTYGQPYLESKGCVESGDWYGTCPLYGTDVACGDVLGNSSNTCTVRGFDANSLLCTCSADLRPSFEGSKEPGAEDLLATYQERNLRFTSDTFQYAIDFEVLPLFTETVLKQSNITFYPGSVPWNQPTVLPTSSSRTRPKYMLAFTPTLIYTVPILTGFLCCFCILLCIFRCNRRNRIIKKYREAAQNPKYIFEDKLRKALKCINMKKFMEADINLKAALNLNTLNKYGVDTVHPLDKAIAHLALGQISFRQHRSAPALQSYLKSFATFHRHWSDMIASGASHEEETKVKIKVAVELLKYDEKENPFRTFWYSDSDVSIDEIKSDFSETSIMKAGWNKSRSSSSSTDSFDDESMQVEQVEHYMNHFSRPTESIGDNNKSTKDTKDDVNLLFENIAAIRNALLENDMSDSDVIRKTQSVASNEPDEVTWGTRTMKDTVITDATKTNTLSLHSFNSHVWSPRLRTYGISPVDFFKWKSSPLQESPSQESLSQELNSNGSYEDSYADYSDFRSESMHTIESETFEICDDFDDESIVHGHSTMI